MFEQTNTDTQLSVEEKLKEILSGELLTNTLDFVAYLRSIGMTSDDTRFFYMGEYTCILIFFKDENNPSGMLIICDCPIEEYDGFPLNEDVKAYARASVSLCRKCGGNGCGHEAMGANKAVFGQEIENLCSSECQFVNPDAEAFEKLKILMDYWKLTIDEGNYKGR